MLYTLPDATKLLGGGKLQSRTVPAASALTSVDPPELNWTPVTAAGCGSVAIRDHVPVSQIPSELSESPASNARPSGLKATESTQLVKPPSGACDGRSAPLLPDANKCTRSSSEPTASNVPVGLNATDVSTAVPTCRDSAGRDAPTRQTRRVPFAPTTVSKRPSGL